MLSTRYNNYVIISCRHQFHYYGTDLLVEQLTTLVSLCMLDHMTTECIAQLSGIQFFCGCNKCFIDRMFCLVAKNMDNTLSKHRTNVQLLMKLVKKPLKHTEYYINIM
jgi:hypothetical protein